MYIRNHTVQSEYPIIATFSIVAVDVDKGDYGVAVASKFIAAGHVVPWAKINIGAVATQAWANVRFGPRALYHLARGLSPNEVIRKLISNDPKKEHRQIGIVDRKGESAAYTGKECIEWAGHITGDGYSVQGNILAGEHVLESMAKAFETTKGELVDKLIASLKAGDLSGGDRRGKQSAAVIVLRKCGGYGGCSEGVGKYVDIRVDDHAEPVKELERIFRIWDLTLLSRDDPSDVVEWSDVWKDIAKALIRLGYLDREPDSYNDPELKEAFRRWIGVNNFENKLRKDNKIWGSIYRYLIESAMSKK